MPKDDPWRTSPYKPPHLRLYRIVRALGYDADTLRGVKARAELAEQRRLTAEKELANRDKAQANLATTDNGE